ncbi:MAG: enoyl-CoA hydratase/isomerase family protein [Chloroflexi bacterium]|nr:enoyl-CoA hydratase/isomerase family protein [Chloroflexota bacterium]
MDFHDIAYSKAEGVAMITLNRPGALNALTSLMAEECVAAIEDAKKDDEIKALILTGAGRGFCAGREVREVSRAGGFSVVSQRHYLADGLHRMPRALADLEKPLVAAVNGVAVGGGMDLASMCDIRIASDSARFGMTYVKMGLLPGDGGCYFLPRIVGIAKACELIWTGRLFDAQEALSIGYVSLVVGSEQLVAVATEFARRLAKGPSVAIQASKSLIYRCAELGLDEALEATERAMLVVRSTEDAREGPRAWSEKREPQFKGK